MAFFGRKLPKEFGVRTQASALPQRMPNLCVRQKGIAHTAQTPFLTGQAALFGAHSAAIIHVMFEMIVGGVRVHITKKRIKNLYLRVKEGGVFVSAPQRCSETEIRSFIESRSSWIQKRLCEPAATMLPVSAEQTEELARLAEALFEKWLAVTGLQPREWRLRNMKTRWGSCSIQAGRIWLNMQLALQPERCVEYVIVHELMHLLERTHGPRFKALMSNYLPDWKQRRKELNAKQ